MGILDAWLKPISHQDGLGHAALQSQSHETPKGIFDLNHFVWNESVVTLSKPAEIIFEPARIRWNIEIREGFRNPSFNLEQGFFEILL